MNIFGKYIISVLSICATISITSAANVAGVIEVAPCTGDATRALQEAIEKAKEYKGKPVTIRLSPGNYDISRTEASRHLYHISNTSSIEENPDQTKHIGLWFRGLKNVTLDGNGAWLVTHGEMTSFVIDDCSGIRLENFTLTAADPSVPEMKILNVDANSMTVEITSPSQFEIVDGDFNWKGEGWQFAEGARPTTYPEFAQVFYPERNVTLRCDSPLKGRKYARQLADNIVQFFYDHTPDVHPGEVYQMRHGIRNEACAFINLSKDITLSNIEFNFLGNFGLVGQYSENLTYDNIRCRPRLGSGRTDAGFADFVQMSGCKGKIRILNSYFEGAHDDPINIHGTHLKAVGSEGSDRITVRFMHGQSYGFQPFFKGDLVEILNRHTLNCVIPAKVKDVKQIDDYNFELTLDRNLPALSEGTTLDDLAVENVTWTPEVEIRNNYFSRIPTRGILITTRGKSVIEDNTFYRLPMPSILVSDDARGWYESGPVHDLTIRRNLFIECGSPAIAIWPEYDRFDKPIHRNINVEGNRFIMSMGQTAISLRGAENITVRDNVFDIPGSDGKITAESLVESTDTSDLKISDNKVVATP
ncbi:MAG: right-handed parallel beta-helix repeat-containing protein [Bacteroides sp.]|nr:right-handed parallel beta-helix repeat-containing protein [Bacteroides sp.]